MNEANKPNTCQVCGVQIKQKSVFVRHTLIHTGEVKHWCRHCYKAFKSKAEAKQHEKQHVSRRRNRYKCKICTDKTFESQDEYLLHVKDVHGGRFVELLMCSECGKRFKSNSELTVHVNSKCGTVKLYECQICHQRLMTAGSLHNHMLRHKGEPSFMCRFCAKLFLTAGQLKVHERSHTQDKAFICDVCGKGFCHRQSLITHSTLHTGIKPYMCENCGNSFSCIGNLLKHRKTHADTCGLIPLVTHTVKHPSTRIKVKVNTPLNSKLRASQREKELQEKFAKLQKPVQKEDNYTDVNCTAENKEIPDAKVHGEDVVAKSNTTSNDENPIISAIEKDLRIITNSLKDNFLLKGKDSLDAINLENILYTNNENMFGASQKAKHTTSSNQREKEITVDVTEKPEVPVEPTNAVEIDCVEEKNKVQVRKLRNKKIYQKRAISKEELEQFIRDRGIGPNNEAKCKYCDKTYNNAKWLLRHELKHNAGKKIKCQCCRQSFETKQECVEHLQSTHADILTCDVCDKFFLRPDSLQSHRKIYHDGRPRKVYTYVCERCGQQFKQKSCLRMHEENGCTDGPLFECDVCHKKLSSAHVRNAHMRIHDPEKRLLCKYCGKSFHWKGQLVIHERSHTGEKPFACLYCPKSFAYRESLITHSSIHTGIKPHLCKACGSRFSCVGNLIKHRNTHASTCGLWYSRNECDSDKREG